MLRVSLHEVRSNQESCLSSCAPSHQCSQRTVFSRARRPLANGPSGGPLSESGLLFVRVGTFDRQRPIAPQHLEVGIRSVDPPLDVCNTDCVCLLHTLGLGAVALRTLSRPWPLNRDRYCRKYLPRAASKRHHSARGPLRGRLGLDGRREELALRRVCEGAIGCGTFCGCRRYRCSQCRPDAQLALRAHTRRG